MHEEGGGHLVSATDGGASSDGGAGGAGGAGAQRREQCSLRTGWYSQRTMEALRRELTETMRQVRVRVRVRVTSR